MRGALLVAVADRYRATDRRRARRAGFDDYIVRPGGLAEMRALLAACSETR
jgi:hypothetical protein